MRSSELTGISIKLLEEMVSGAPDKVSYAAGLRECLEEELAGIEFVRSKMAALMASLVLWDQVRGSVGPVMH